MKKLKSILLSATVAVSLLSASSSAFALGDAKEPDSFNDPNVFSGISDAFEGTIVLDPDKGMDFDYYKWTNDTGQDKSFFVNFDTYQNRSLDYMIREIDVGGSSNRISSETGREVWQIYLRAGETLRIKVGARNALQIDPNVKYVISLGNNPWF
ncbi:hypothetical protein SAMN04487970_101776 [Paenibacillus tianmuensis]|uniref:Uncharacterized protein n=1 Tax=Paenibacillus tianmuensis TaxID=624147 RepID=A0A1G4RND6_9BACL|nr:hypothetical protein [Paenibacillus tianmuensis]SCW58442.1 hypothetical protein SAMN04487970_101776 [Paenibacillus tianmuensis]